MSNRSCFKNALIAANFNIKHMNIQNWVTHEQMLDICNQLDITFHHGETVSVGENEAVIAIFPTRKGKSHAVFTNNLKSLVETGIKLNGLITF